MHLTKLSLALALAGASAQMYCPAGHGMYTTTVRVSRSEDDVEEAEHPTGKCAKGMLYQGSSDLELGNDVECGATGQYIGIRFQNLDVPSGAKIMTAHLKFTVDESTNPTVEGGSTTSYWGNWTAPMTVTIHGHKTPDAGPWLDPASKDPHVASNRDCTLDSKCMPGYDCNSLASSSQGWGINGGSTHPFLEGQTCEWYENGGYVDSVCDSGIDSTGEYSFCSWIADKAGSSSGDMETDSSKKVRQCDCSACFCGRDPANPSQPGFTAPHILSEILKNEVTDAIQVWHPEGEDISKDQISERRPTMVTPEIRAIVQEIVDMGGWSPGNSIAFIIDGIDAFDCKPGNEGDQSINNEGGGGNCALRTFESFDGANKNDQWWTSVEPPYGPHLEVSYCAPVTCPEGQMPGTAVMRVEQGIDDVEEAQSAPDRIEGMLYQGSSDLELANDATGHGAQYFGVRFQGVPIPAGSTVKSATMMLSIDESTNTDEARYNEFVTAHIKMRKTADAPEWLPKDSTDPAVVANRDCPLDSKCMSGYTCHDIAGWASYGMPFPATAAEASANDGSPTTCAWIEKNAAPIIDQVFGGGNRITKSDTCDCTGCNCDFGMGPKPAVLKKIWEGEQPPPPLPPLLPPPPPPPPSRRTSTTSPHLLLRRDHGELCGVGAGW